MQPVTPLGPVPGVAVVLNKSAPVAACPVRARDRHRLDGLAVAAVNRHSQPGGVATPVSDDVAVLPAPFAELDMVEQNQLFDARIEQPGDVAGPGQVGGVMRHHDAAAGVLHGHTSIRYSANRSARPAPIAAPAARSRASIEPRLRGWGSSRNWEA